MPRLIHPGAGTVVVARTDGIYNALRPLTTVNDFYRGRGLGFVISDTRDTNIIPIGVRRVRVSTLTFAKRGKLLTPRNVNNFILHRDVVSRVAPLVINNANDLDRARRAPHFVPSGFRTNALGLPNVTDLRTSLD